MKQFKKLLVFALAFFIYTQTYARRARVIVYGEEQKIEHVVDLPNTEDFKTTGGDYFDIGSMYTKNHILWVSLYNTDPVLVGYVRGKDEYIELSAENIQEIEKKTNIKIPEADTSFFDKYISKLVVACIIATIILSTLTYYKDFIDRIKNPKKPYDI